MFGWLEVSWVFMRSIQAFWFVALAEADRIAISPVSPICLAIMSTSTLAMPSAVAWLMNRLRHSGLVSEWTLASGAALAGPTSAYVPPSSPIAVLPPLSEVSKYALPRFLGRKVDVLRHRQVGEERGLLVDDRDAGSLRLGGGLEVDDVPVALHRAGVPVVQT